MFSLAFIPTIAQTSVLYVVIFLIALTYQGLTLKLKWILNIWQRLSYFFTLILISLILASLQYILFVRKK